MVESPRSGSPSAAATFDAPGFLRRHVALPFAVWAVVAAIFELTPLDLMLSDPFYDTRQRAWLGLHNYFVGHVLYYGGRYLVVAIGVTAFTIWIASFRIARLATWRRAAIYVALCMATTGSGVSLLKHLIDRGTPADYDRYGGSRPYTPLFGAVPNGLEAIHQFPAAHPSGAFALFALYFVARSRASRPEDAIDGIGTSRPALWLIPGAALGTLYSFVQQIRGMHFASHDWWTMGIAWGVAVGLFRLFRGQL